jgi:hypothetical protein
MFRLDDDEKQILGWGGLAAGLGFVLWKWGNPVTAIDLVAQWASNLVGRGSVLSSSTLVSGIVAEDPASLNDQASVVLGFDSVQDTYSLARAGRSEGVDGMEYRMHVILNMLQDDQSKYGLGVYSSVTALAIHSKTAAANGHYSGQGHGKPFSTAHDPFESDYALALKVQADHDSGIDPTNGAVKFVDKSGPFYINDVKVTYADIVASWASEGLTPVEDLPGATDNFVVFVRA